MQILSRDCGCTRSQGGDGLEKPTGSAGKQLPYNLEWFQCHMSDAKAVLSQGWGEEIPSGWTDKNGMKEEENVRQASMEGKGYQEV